MSSLQDEASQIERVWDSIWRHQVKLRNSMIDRTSGHLHPHQSAVWCLRINFMSTARRDLQHLSENQLVPVQACRVFNLTRKLSDSLVLTFNIYAQIDGSPSLPAAACRFFCAKITSKCPDEFREVTEPVCPGHLDSRVTAKTSLRLLLTPEGQLS